MKKTEKYSSSSTMIKFFENDVFASKRLNHAIIIKTSDIENVSNEELCVCKQETTPGIYML